MPAQGEQHGMLVQEISFGPLPDPAVLEEYKNADTSFPERIMRMAEAHNQADVNTKNRMSLSYLITPIIGQIFTLTLGIGGMLAGIYLARAGFSTVAIAIIACCFSPVIINILRGLRRK